MAEEFSVPLPEELNKAVNSCWAASESVSGLPLLLDDKEVEEALRDALSYGDRANSCTCESREFQPGSATCGSECIHSLDADSLMAVADDLMQHRGISEAPILTIIRVAVTDPNVLSALVANENVRQALSKIRKVDEERGRRGGNGEDKNGSLRRRAAEEKGMPAESSEQSPQAGGNTCDDTRSSEGENSSPKQPGGHSIFGKVLAGLRDMVGDAATVVGCALRGYKGGGGIVRDHLGRVGMLGGDASDFDNWCVRVERQSFSECDAEDDGSGGELVGFALIVAVLVVVFMLLRRSDAN